MSMFDLNLANNDQTWKSRSAGMWCRIFWGTGADDSHYNWRNPRKTHGSWRSTGRNSFFWLDHIFTGKLDCFADFQFFFFSAKASGCRRSGRVPSKLSKYEFASQQLTFESHLLQGVLRLTTDFVSEYLYLIFHQERKSETSKPLSPAASKYHLISSYYETFRI